MTTKTDWSDAATSVKMPTVTRSWKKQRMDSSLEHPEKTLLFRLLDYSPMLLISEF